MQHPFSCPSCGQDQPRGKDECVKCGIIFTKWEERRQRLQSAPRLAQTHEAYRSPTDRIVAVLPKFLMLSAIPMGIWLYVKAPSGCPIPPGAYIDKEYHFAVSQPEGWKVSTEKTIREGCSEVLVMTQPGNADNPTRLIVVVSALWASDIRKNVRERFSKLMKDVFQSMPNDFKQDSEGIVELDNMEVLKISGQATRLVAVEKTRIVEPPKPRFQSNFYNPYVRQASPTPAQPTIQNYTENETQELFYSIYVVPGAERSYLLGLIGSPAAIKSQSKVLDDLIYSFRVTERSFSWPHLKRILSGELKQEVLLLILGVIAGFYRWVFSDLFE